MITEVTNNPHPTLVSQAHNVSPTECFPDVSHRTATQNNIIEILGDTISQVVVSCKYYDAIKYRRNWSRRQVETIEFESERTLKRRLTIDIDYDELNQLRREYGQCGSKCYVPVVDNLERGPLLTANLTNGGKSNIAIARRYENATIGAATLVGQVIREMGEDSKGCPSDYQWVLPLLNYLIDMEREIDSSSAISCDTDNNESNTPADDERLRSLSEKVLQCLSLRKIATEFQQYKLNYTLFIVVPCEEPAKFSTDSSTNTNSSYSFIGDGRIGIIKLERYESISVKRGNEKRQNVVYSNSRHLSTATGTLYVLSLPLFGRGLRGRHTRIVCPKGMVIDSVRMFSGNVPYKLDRLPDGSDSAKYWSIHRGYIESNHLSESESIVADPNSTKTHAASNEAALEMIYNRKRVELHDLKLPPQLSSNGNSRSTNAYWQVQLNLSSNRSHFLVPALGLLLCTMYALSINIHHIAQMGDRMGEGGRFSISSVSTLSLPLLLGLLMVGEEHRILSKALAGLRSLIGWATFFSVVTACTLSVVNAKLLSNGSLSGIIIWCLFSFTLLIGISTMSLIMLHITRIQKYRTDAFEEVRYIEDRVRNELADSPAGARYLNKLCKRDWWKASWKLWSQMCPGPVRSAIKGLWFILCVAPYNIKWLLVG